MDHSVLRIGTRESHLAVWQATLVKSLLAEQGYESRLEFIKSEGDIDLKTPLYEMGVQGIFTRSLDIALLENRIDIAVHSMKDVPTRLPRHIVQAAVLERASYKDLLVYQCEAEYIEAVLNTDRQHHKNDFTVSTNGMHHAPIVATSSIRRKAQWLHRYPGHRLENLRGNVNTRLRKVAESSWTGAIFAAAGLERIGLRPAKSIELDWMLPAPAQGAIMVVARQHDEAVLEACSALNHEATAFCTKAEKDFLRVLMGGCSTPISALAQWVGDQVTFKGSIFSTDGQQKVEVEKVMNINEADEIGALAAHEILQKGGGSLATNLQHETE